MNNMTLEQAIAHAQEVAASKCDECGKEHAQLAEWLQELTAYKGKTYISAEWLTKNKFEKREYDFLYCDDVEEISAQCIDAEMGVWHVSIGFLDHCENTESLNICTIGQFRMFLAICGLDNLVNEFK